MAAEELQHALNRVAGTTDMAPQGAANVYAGTTGLSLMGALGAWGATYGTASTIARIFFKVS